MRFRSGRPGRGTSVSDHAGRHVNLIRDPQPACMMDRGFDAGEGQLDLRCGVVARRPSHQRVDPGCAPPLNSQTPRLGPGAPRCHGRSCGLPDMGHCIGRQRRGPCRLARPRHSQTWGSGKSICVQKLHLFLHCVQQGKRRAGLCRPSSLSGFRFSGECVSPAPERPRSWAG